MTLEEYQATWGEEDWKHYNEQLPEYPNLGRTTWTREQVEALSEAHDAHLAGCEECQQKLDESINTVDNCDHESCNGECYLISYCPIGRGTMNAWLDAGQEYSWQPDFDGHGDGY